MYKYYKIRCYAMKVDNSYFAASITLNLTTTGRNINEAKEKLNKIIFAYLDESISNKPLNECKHLLNRPAPLYMYFDYIKCFIFHHVVKTKEFFTFTEKPSLNMVCQVSWVMQFQNIKK